MSGGTTLSKISLIDNVITVRTVSNKRQCSTVLNSAYRKAVFLINCQKTGPVKWAMSKVNQNREAPGRDSLYI